MIAILAAIAALASGVWLGRFTKAEYRYAEGVSDGMNCGFAAGQEAATEICAELNLEVARDMGILAEWLEASSNRVAQNEVEALERMAGK